MWLIHFYFQIITLLPCRDPSPWWHVAHFAIRSNSIRTPPKRDTWRAPLSGLPQGEAHVTRECHARMITYPIRINNWSEQVLIHHSDSLPQPTFRRLQSERTGMMASRLPRSLTAIYRVMMALPPPRGIMTSQKVFPSLKREAELLTLYIRTFTQEGR